MTDRHSELEAKFAADHVSEASFRVWCAHRCPRRLESPAYPDNYYRHGDNVIRHRLLSPAGELTVKRRKSAVDITDRVEIDLTFATAVSRDDVEAFLAASGWAKDLTLIKNFSHVFWFTHGGASVTVALYEVKREDNSDTRRFLEVEIEKGSDVSEAVARNILSAWVGMLEEDFDLSAPLTESLYELYSGRRYLI